jgi:carbon-monoxide dehydrogenase medium subunit
MIPAAFDYVRASTVDQALQVLAEGGKVLAGGQSLLPLLKMRLASAPRLVDIGRLEELRGTRFHDDGSLSMGPLVTYADVIASTRFGWVREAVELIGDVQVRNRATVGGAIAHCDPASDFPAIALALDGSVVLRSARGVRELALDGFFHGPFQTAMAEDELLVELRRPAVPDGAGGAYRSLEQPASGYSLAGVAAVVAFSGGAIGHARIAVTGVADVPYRAKSAEQALLGTDGSAAAVAAAAALVTEGRVINSDIHAAADYRAAVAQVYARRAIEAAIADARR